ncbi:plasmid stabilization protein [Candidatus Desantisbacteria bacterium CG2_30_40_21]|uniref:Plasmid stabilization protein n=5 Tax=unclassified Candidatus Desantisiibacteriota TaxID=3106372 RepID=A0A2M7JCU6_9BACT|nr:MAG: plasmid stabilization protein [Candidatus Desantisbacteria bacterium CG2_30_40_21]PIP40808.1 MAG: plasmid stabilization protein [Candidatus Desantisbacteria bacterium CG23_combo_of_CG06-09_8_20_14_all_40_23]PIX17239.1 MAG: plasmid stabilization protein [Candidatus Desantisbacteria bacterium CG_4_8_14_3_um_filter_40_12]PIY20028.1 MAG: plasmid stabilization protein [Candidatus Desantisbacteria bacterium CG_4_10_14_3_um_filter_40_18]PJB30263.1 MAG: plasmid stabilization protein [Candidatus
MSVIFNELARYELENAIEFYGLVYSGLGQRFKEEIKKSVKRIVEHPTAWSLERGEVRKYLVHRFPYKILYSIEKEYIYIIAVGHQHQKPNYWVDRM